MYPQELVIRGELPSEIAEALGRVQQVLDEPDRIYPGNLAEQIGHAVNSAFRGNVNFYPGKSGAGCYEACFIWAFKPEDPSDRSRGHLSFGDALRKLRNHADACQHTRQLILVTNEWWAPAFKDWEDSLRRLRGEGRDVHFILRTGPGRYTVVDA